MNSMARLTDDASFFSEQLINDLAKHGAILEAKYKKLGGRSYERASVSDFSSAHHDGSIPSPDNYADWFRAFPSTGK